jgi:molybdopterin synthase sulfur carrier subunit
VNCFESLTLKVQVRYFASLRETLGSASTTYELPVEVQTVNALRLWLCGRDESHASALAAHKAVRAAHNQTMCTDDVALNEGDEVAFFPPVTGG